MKVAKIILGILAVVLLGLTVGYFYLNWLARQPCPPPDKPTVVPKEAVWKGGCDGGNWIELIKTKEDNKYRFRIYWGHDGSLALDADFSFKKCKEFTLTKSNWSEYVTWYSGQFLGVKNLDQNDEWYCRLYPIYPAYGGDEWEIMKEKEGWEKEQE